eukprot:1507667-Amphidinium_carterae.1
MLGSSCSQMPEICRKHSLLWGLNKGNLGKRTGCSLEALARRSLPYEKAGLPIGESAVAQDLTRCNETISMEDTKDIQPILASASCQRFCPRMLSTHNAICHNGP